MTGCMGRALRLFSGVDFGMDLERDHKISPKEKGARDVPGFGVRVD